jgi:hypothetical protein
VKGKEDPPLEGGLNVMKHVVSRIVHQLPNQL